MKKIFYFFLIVFVFFVGILTTPQKQVFAAAICCGDYDCNPGQVCNGENCSDAYNPTFGLCVSAGGGGCTNDGNCPGCQSCNVSTGACYDDSSWCHGWVGNCSSCGGASCSPSTCNTPTPTPIPTGTIVPTPTPNAPGGGYYCSDWLKCFAGADCSKFGECYKVVCNKQCGQGGDCVESPSCSTTTQSCSPSGGGQDCPVSGPAGGSCAPGCWFYDKCGCADGCTAACVSGKCVWSGNQCSATGPVPTATPTPAFPNGCGLLPDNQSNFEGSEDFRDWNPTTNTDQGRTSRSALHSVTAPYSLVLNYSNTTGIPLYTFYTPFNSYPTSSQQIIFTGKVYVTNTNSTMQSGGTLKACIHHWFNWATSHIGEDCQTLSLAAGAQNTWQDINIRAPYRAGANMMLPEFDITGNGSTVVYVDNLCISFTNNISKTCAINSLTDDLGNTGVNFALGRPLTVKFNGNNMGITNPSDNVQLWLEKWDTRVAISPTPPGVLAETGGFYKVGNCVSTGANSCPADGTYTINNLPEGEYYFHCDVPSTVPGRCSGNPYCGYESLPNNSPITCTNWQSCSEGDNRFFRVTCDPNVGGTQWTECSGSPATSTRLDGCGNTQTHNCTGDIHIRAHAVSSSTARCDQVIASSNGMSGITHTFTAGSASQPSGVQTGNNYVNFNDIPGGSYSISPQGVPAGYTLKFACASPTDPPGVVDTQSTYLSSRNPANPLNTGATPPGDSEDITWDLGYIVGQPWVQTGGGHVYAKNDVDTLVPTGKLFNLDGAALYPGLVVPGSGNCDFNGDGTCGNESTISRYNWIATQSHPDIDYYDFFYKRLGSPSSPAASTTLTSQLASNPTTPYYYTGPLTIDSVWTVDSGKTIIVFVEGNLIIKKNITVTGTGFVAFIVHGDISIDPSVGTSSLLAGASPQIEGVYIATNAGHTATFRSGDSSNNGTERLILNGMFIADTFSLQRDLDDISVGANVATPAELFTYEPNLFINMPDSLKDVPITWEEVAP